MATTHFMAITTFYSVLLFMYFYEIFKMCGCHDNTFKFHCVSDASRLWGFGICDAIFMFRITVWRCSPDKVAAAACLPDQLPAQAVNKQP